MGVFNFFSTKPKIDKDEAAFFEKILITLNDEQIQNESYTPELKEAIIAGGSIDCIPNPKEGIFGKSTYNPIPVNGYLGEMAYISKLLTENGSTVIGHRLGCVHNCDIYEVLSIDGQVWDILFFDMYHTRKSRLLPSGYIFKKERIEGYHATNSFIPNFPEGFKEALKSTMIKLVGIPILSRELHSLNNIEVSNRPLRHAKRVEGCLQAINFEKENNCLLHLNLTSE